MPLYEIDGDHTRQLKAGRFNLERDLQNLCEKNLLRLFGVRFIASEFTTSGQQPGRIDTLGLDQDGSPTIIEYKRSQKDNVINQGLFYLDWLVDHKGDFVVAAQQVLGDEVHEQISWLNPRLILVAQEFTVYDKYAVNRIGANVELWTYRLYDGRFLLLETLYATRSQKPSAEAEEIPVVAVTSDEAQQEKPRYELDHHLANKSARIQKLFYELREGILQLGSASEDIVETVNKLYISYRHGRNFVEVVVQAKGLKLFLDIPFEELNDPQQMGRDMPGIGHWGTGDVEVRVERAEDLEYVLDLIEQAYKYTL
jgi:predicted transport protein